MTAVGLGQQGSQAVGSSFESLSCQVFLTIYNYHFSIPEISKTLKGSPTKFFGTVRQKIFDRKSWYSLFPPSSVIHNFFRYKKFCETQKGSTTKFFDTVRQQIFYWKWWYFPLRHKIFRYPKLSETQKGSSTKLFGTVRQKFFHG